MTEIYKVNFTKFISEKYRDHSSINQRNIVFGEVEDLRHPLFVIENKFHDEETFVKNFANPIYSVFRYYCMIVIEEEGDKLSLKFFYGGKNRAVGKSWFKVSRNVEFLTVNKKTGDFYRGYLHNYQKKRKFTQVIRRNYFQNNPFSSILSSIKNHLTNFCDNSSEVVFEVANKFLERLDLNSVNLDNDQKLMKFYLDKKNFKYPNNFWIYVNFMWGKEYRKILKKNDKKLVDTFMQIWNVKGKKLKKYLHEVNFLNVELYISAKKLFGEDWLNQDGDIIKEILSSNGKSISIPENFKSYLSNEELKKVYSVFKGMIINDTMNNWTFNDHVRNYTSLKEFGENEIKWTTDGNDYNKFQAEHLDWTDKLEHYRKGSYTRIYPDYFYERIEKPLDDFFPVLLKSSDDYNHESFNQSNCVKGYIGRASSMIISLRKNSPESTERATIEYRIVFLKNLEKVHVDRVQTLGKFNQNLDLSWNEVLLKLDEVVLSCYQDKNFKTVSIEKVCQNGTKLSSGSHFDNNGNLQWTERKTSNNYYTWDF